MKGRLTQMRNRLTQTPQMLSDSSEVIDLLRTEIDAAAFDGKDHEVGEILRVGDGVATVSGIRHAAYGEIVQFESGVKGMVQDIRREETGIILLGSEKGLLAGGRVVRTERRAGVPVGEAFLGRVVDAMGTPIDGKGEAVPAGYRPIENAAPALRTESPFRSRWRPVFWPSTACSPLAGDSVSSSSATGRPVRPLSPPIPF